MPDRSAYLWWLLSYAFFKLHARLRVRLTHRHSLRPLDFEGIE
jgi:hypothetical protein